MRGIFGEQSVVWGGWGMGCVRRFLLFAQQRGSFRLGLMHCHMASGESTPQRGCRRIESVFPPLGARAGGKPAARRSQGRCSNEVCQGSS